ncbi:unnamed protein product [Adineta steineri]|uniref:Rhodanese domain-containing protein n=1 Tax=Adineta steineri TaxID=433720 RepID=A0A814U231_9BILA|nr:unnamed protein product [Adineta steineri]
MARTEPSNINHCVAPSITSRVSNFTKDSNQRSDEIKTEFTSREGTYKISSLIDNLGKIGSSTCLNEPVKITLLPRIQTIYETTNSQTSSRRSSSTNNQNDHSIEQKQTSISNGNETNQQNGNIFLTDILAFNVGRELIVYEFAEATQSNFGDPLDHRVYKQNHQPTCHDITQNPDTNGLHILVGFSKGQIQYINMQTKEQKVFNEGSNFGDPLDHRVYKQNHQPTCHDITQNPDTNGLHILVGFSKGQIQYINMQTKEQKVFNEGMKATKTIPALLSCHALKDLLRSSSQKISVLEADIGKQFENEFRHGHIPKARYFDQLECTKPSKLIPRGLPETKCFESYLSKMGVSNSDHIVLYDRSPIGFYATSRAWWLFKTLGVDSLSILNGGFYKWLKEINELESSDDNASKSQEETGKFTVHKNEEMLKNYKDMLHIVSTNDKEQQIVDARPPNLFYGSNAGHLPNSVNVPYTDVFDQTNQCLKSKDELKQSTQQKKQILHSFFLLVFNSAGVDLSKPAIYSCQTGTTASTLAFAAHILGQESLSVYNGSFTEWQQRAPKEFIINNKIDTPAA